MNAGQFYRWLFALPWCDAATRAHDGYARDAFHTLLDSKRPPAGGWRELVWRVSRVFTALQKAGA
jgi:hypothetical protein